MKVRKLGMWTLAASLFAVLSVGFAACGDDDDDSTDDGGGITSSSGTGSDEEYVADICKATNDFSKSMQKITSDPSKLSNPSDISKVFGEPFDNYAKAVAKAKPPKDVKQYHEQVVKSLNDASKAIKDGGDLEKLSSVGEDFPEPPQDIQDRLQKVAEKNKDCQEADFTFN